MTREYSSGRLVGIDRPVRGELPVWADGIHVNIRLQEERLCLLVLIGVRADGTKELIG